MTRRRSRIVALQAVVVGVLLVVVFLTLLQPQGSGPLFGVDKPGLPGVAQSPNPSYEPEHPPGGPRRGGRGRRGGPAGPGGAGPGSSAGGGLPAPTPPLPSNPPPAQSGPDGGADESPTGEQYDDTLTRLAALLN